MQKSNLKQHKQNHLSVLYDQLKQDMLCWKVHFLQFKQKTNQRTLGARSLMLWLKFALIPGLAEFRYSWIWFMCTFKTFGIHFLLFLGSHESNALLFPIKIYEKLASSSCIEITI